MAQDIFIKFENAFDGESADSIHAKEVDVQSWDWKIYQQANSHQGSGGGAGKATVQDFEFTHYMDKSSPNLVSYCGSGKHIDKVIFTIRKAGGEKPIEYVKIIMEKVLVTMVNPYGQRDDDVRCKETVHLSFAKITQEYTTQDEKGAAAGTISASYDVKANKVA